MKVKFLIFLFLTLTSKGQFFDNAQSVNSTTQGLDLLYNKQFSSAERFFSIVENNHPNHPVNHLIKAVTLQWKYLPIDKNPASLKNYIKELELCISEARKIYKIPKYRSEAVFFYLRVMVL